MTAESISSRLVKEIQDDFEDGFQLMDVITITANIVKLLQQDSSLKNKGKFKKALAIVIFRQLVDDTILSDKDAEKIGDFMVNDLPALIDLFKSLGQEIADGIDEASCCCPWW